MNAQPAEAIPKDMRKFRRELELNLSAICGEIFHSHRDEIQVRNERIAVANLGRIIDATLTLANRKGFTAMSLRELTERAGLSLGGLYAYIKSKDDLVVMIQAQVQRQLERAMAGQLADIDGPAQRLATAIRTHIYLSEALLPWFQFLYMEARHLAPRERRQAIVMEQASETLFAEIIQAGQKAGEFRDCDAHVAAGLLKAVLQDWYLKRRKHEQRGLGVAEYAAEIEQFAIRYLLHTSDLKETP